jgi:hypothetical protein
MCRRVNLTGKRFGRLTVEAIAPQPVDRVATKARWLCKCDCGNEIVTRTDYLRAGRTTSCGCWLNGARIPDNGSAWNQVYSKLRGMARKTATRTVAWELTREQVLALVVQRCHYCNREPSQVRHSDRHHQTVLFNGLDRLDSDLGYVPGNVVPCCKYCNYAKHTQGYQQFKEWVARVYAHFVKPRPLVDQAAHDNLNLFDQSRLIQ